MVERVYYGCEECRMLLSCGETPIIPFSLVKWRFQILSTLQSFRGHKRKDLVKGDISKLLFRHAKTQRACQIFLEWLKKNNQEASPSELSKFARDLQTGIVIKKFKYRRESFYSVILKRLLELGFISKQTRHSNRIVYAPIIQPIPKRAPILTSWWGFAYLIAEKWNGIFEPSV